MLVLSRKKDEKIMIGDDIVLMVIALQGDKVRLGIKAPKDIIIHRQEVYDAIQRKTRANTTPPETAAIGGTPADLVVVTNGIIESVLNVGGD